ncbi:MAG: SMC-Scp complex subunit ScpB [Myxococcota bacterium]|nr:SMC-Scp complex subunit ScpB [Myxococcota bacterium]
MSTGSPHDPSDPPEGQDLGPGSGGPSPFTEEEVARVTEQPADAELDDVDAADIDEREPDLETPFEKLVQKSKKLSPERIQTVIQSLLFLSDKALTLDQLFEATGIDRPLIQTALEKTGGQLREGISGIVLHEVASGWQFRTDPGSAEYVRRFLRVKPQRLTRAAVESLAIIAYRQPVTRPEIEDIRGVDSGAVLKALLDRKLIKIMGKKDEVGRPILYGTTREFLEFFALKDLSALPTLREFHELTQEHQEIVERVEKPTAEGTVATLADPEFEKRLEQQSKDSEAALEELERAIDTADERSKTAASILNPKSPPTEGGTEDSSKGP